MVTPLTILAVHRRARVEPRRQPDRERRRQGAARGAGEGDARARRRPRRAPTDSVDDARAARRDPGGRAHARQPGVGELPALRQPGRDPQAAALGLPRHDRTRRSSPGSPGNASIEDEGEASVLVQARGGQARTSTNATRSPTGAPVLLKDINDYLTRRHAHARRHRRRDHGRDPAGAVQRALAAAAARSWSSSASSGRSASPATSASRSRSSRSPASR